MIGVYTSLKIETHDDWFVAGRSLGLLPLVGTMFATTVSTVSLIGYLGYYYQMGWGGWWNWGGSILSFIIGALFFSKKLRRLGKRTMSEMLEARYGKVHAIIASVIIFVGMLFFVSAQLVGSAAIVTAAVDVDRNIVILVIGAIFILFTVSGGMEAVAWTDTFCSAVIFLGTLILMFTALGKVGGIGNLHTTLAQVKPSALDPWAGGQISIGIAVSWILTWGIGNYGSPHIVTRINSAKTPEIAAWSQALTSVASLAFFIPLMLIGLAAIVLFPSIPATDQATPYIIKHLLSPWTGGIMMASILAAAISTADSVLLMAGTTFVNDILLKVSKKEYTSKQILRTSRIATLTIGVLGIVFSFYTNSGVMWIQANMVGILGAMLSIVVLGAFAWRRANAQGALAAMVTGVIVALVWLVLDKPFGLFPILPGSFAALAAYIIVSLLTPPPPQEVIDEFFNV
ncbi:sodium:solute symporter family protein [Synergistaceae bacterium OttesenSCG-928-D05]|nr:sodium:solute symporter family protein [Synergistaceae bacterium OttesenSCG-928-D05]